MTIGLHPCDLLALDLRIAEHYLDWSGFGHVREENEVGLEVGVLFAENVSLYWSSGLRELLGDYFLTPSLNCKRAEL
jgi:hypothetical protein